MPKLKKIEEAKQQKKLDHEKHQSKLFKDLTEDMNSKLDVITDDLAEAKIDRESIKECIDYERKALQLQMKTLTKYVQDVQAANQKETQYNEYIYYRIFHVIAQRVGSSQQWEKLGKILLKSFPEEYIHNTLQTVDQQHSYGPDKAFEILMTWKVFTAEDIQITSLLKVLEPLRLDIGDEIDKIATIQERNLNPEDAGKNLIYVHASYFSFVPLMHFHECTISYKPRR